MRGQILHAPASVQVEEDFTLTVEVFNDRDVIDRVGVAVVGIDAANVGGARSLALFPGAREEVTLTVRLGASFPAGTVVLPVELQSAVDPLDVTQLTAIAEVEARPEPAVTVSPGLRRAGRSAEFEVEVTNLGNRPLTATLAATDRDEILALTFDQAFLTVAPGTAATTHLRAEGPRAFIGGDLRREITVTAAERGHRVEASATFVQKPRIPRGALTIAALVFILLAWSIVFLEGTDRVLAGESYDKVPAASYYGLLGAGVAGGRSTAPDDGTRGIDVTVAGGTVSGSVTGPEPALAGVPRLRVDLFRRSGGGVVLATSSATEEDGTFTAGPVLPGEYLVRVSGDEYGDDGYPERWAPVSPSAPADSGIRIRAAQDVAVDPIVVVGRPGSARGTVRVGAGADTLPVTIEITDLVGDVPGTFFRSVTSTTGDYLVADLPTPARYRARFVVEAFEPPTIDFFLGGAANIELNPVQLNAGTGSITGTVLAASGGALGGVAVTAVSGADEFATTTPTSGSVGSFTLADLPKPATYLLSFELEDYGTETLVVDLPADGAVAPVQVTMTEGVGSITGRACSGDAGIGGVSVLITGNGASSATTTITGTEGGANSCSAGTGTVGRFAQSGLAVPGTYTVSFQRDGLTVESTTVELTRAAPSRSGLQVDLAPNRFTITGTVALDSGSGAVDSGGVTVELHDGTTTRTTTSASSPAGRFSFGNVVPGSYTLRYLRDGYVNSTVLVSVSGTTTVGRVTLVRPA